MVVPELYRRYHLDKDYTLIGLFRCIKQQFPVLKVIYPGSYVHLTPSLIFREVVYVDSFRGVKKFFDDPDTLEYVHQHMEYDKAPIIRCYQQDFFQPLANEVLESFDLIISQYAGFPGQAVKKYLRKGGVLVCNNSHGEATMASLDPDYSFVAVYQRKSDEKFTISDRNLETYLIPKKQEVPTVNQLYKSMKGIGYTKSPTGYIFEKH